MGSLDKFLFRPVASSMGLALLLGSAGILLSQQPSPETQRQPDPSVRAARLSFVEGEVQISQGNQVLADPALANTPLFEGTVITTREDGRAEVQLDNGSVVRIAPNGSLRISVLRQQDNMTDAEMQVQAGLAYFELQGDNASSRTVARFDDSSVTSTGFTVFRLNVDNPPGDLALFSGNAHLERGNTLSLDLHGGESVALNGSDPNLYNLAETIEPDSWDAWNADRDQQLTSEQASRTAASNSEPNSSNPAWGDLDANGSWFNVPGQGYVWSPYEAASGDWDPYGCGNWVFSPGYGYVWVSCEDWGYLPYSFGNWNYYDGFGWGWEPGYGNPWWTAGGWGWNIGTRPTRYLPPHRPHGGPVHPTEPIHHAGSYQPHPVIAVNRIPASPTGNPVHTVGGPVTIAGARVEPMRPLSPRPTYSNGYSNSYQVSGGSIGPRYGTTTYVPWTNSGSRPGGWTMPATPGYHPSAPPRYSGGSMPGRPYGGAAPHVSSGGAPHVSGGGGGGGGGHASGGGGGGGGGHAGGGGGGAPAGHH